MTFAQNWQKVLLKIVAFFLLGGIIGSFWTFLLFQKGFLPINSASVSAKTQTSNEFLQVFNTPKIQKVYKLLSQQLYGFEGKTQTEIENGFLHSLVASFGDKYTEYFDEKWTEEFESSLTGEFYGIGAVVAENPLGAKIERIIDDSPAQKSGLQVGDIVISANGESLAGKTSTESVEYIRWEKGTTVSLEYIRNDEKFSVDIVRDAVHLASVEGKMLTGTTMWYVQINTFGEKTPDEFLQSINELLDQWAKGLILDFRFNGGGYLESVQSMLSFFFPKNTPIVKVKTNDPRQNEILYTDENNFFGEIPVVVLVNELSASASEIFAGAMQDYNRGIIIGKKTYGKGSVQEMFPLGDGTMIKITNAKWYTPKDKNIDEQGIEPDISVDFTQEDYKNIFDRQLDVAKNALEKILNGQNSEEIIRSLTQ